MAKIKFASYFIHICRRLTVVTAATVIIVGYVYLLNFFGDVFGAGQGWDNPLLWFICAMSALAVVLIACWTLNKLMKWIGSRVIKR